MLNIVPYFNDVEFCLRLGLIFYSYLLFFFFFKLTYVFSYISLLSFSRGPCLIRAIIRPGEQSTKKQNKTKTYNRLHLVRQSYVVSSMLGYVRRIRGQTIEIGMDKQTGNGPADLQKVTYRAAFMRLIRARPSVKKATC